MLDYLIFDNFDSRDFGLIVSAKRSFNAPGRNYQLQNAYGRIGSFLRSEKNYQKTIVEYDCILLNCEDSQETLSEIRSLLFSNEGFVRLEDSDNPDYYYLAFFADSFEIKKNLNNNSFLFTLKFIRQPQRFLINGCVEIFNPLELRNPFRFSSFPIIRFENNESSGEFRINNNLLSFFDLQLGEKIVFDCEKLNAVSETGENKNKNIFIENDIYLSKGNNIISTSGVLNYSIIPRWWTI